jgi:translation initiation factor 1
MAKNNSHLVYSTETGSIKASDNQSLPQPDSDGIVRIRRETKGRKGKGVTIISGLALSGSGLKTLAKQLKKTCSTGGTVKDHVIEIQGDHRNTLKTELEKLGHIVKLTGG